MATEWWDLARGSHDHRVDQAPCDRSEASRSGVAGITASVAQRRSYGLERSPERPGGHDQHRASGVCRRRATRELADCFCRSRAGGGLVTVQVMPQAPQERLIAAVVVFNGSGQLIAGQLARVGERLP